MNPRVLVVGGGPAGAGVALALAEQGVSALVIDRATSLRDKPGECLTPNFRPLLERLGLLDVLAQHRRIPELRSRWDDGRTHARALIRSPYGEGWLLDRRRFEAQLIALAIERGANWQLGWTPTQVTRCGQAWIVELGRASERRTLEVDVLIDATGRAGKLLRMLGEPRQAIDRLFGSWLVTSPQARCDGPVLIEVDAEGWWYASALADGRQSLVWFSDRAASSAEVMLSRARECELIGSSIGEGSIVGSMSVHAAGSARPSRACGPGWFAVGDAAQAFDPLSSYGIGSALATGYYAARALLAYWTGDDHAQASYQSLLDQRWLAYLDALAERHAARHPWSEQRFWVERRRRVEAMRSPWREPRVQELSDFRAPG